MFLTDVLDVLDGGTGDTWLVQRARGRRENGENTAMSLSRVYKRWTLFETWLRHGTMPGVGIVSIRQKALRQKQYGATHEPLGTTSHVPLNLPGV
jgi:hypothetical protein